VKADGMKTYFASDCGYILEKMNRAHLDGKIGFDTMIETWGADHHGYVNRFRAAAQALGFGGELRFNIVQLVRLVKDGEEVRMSKREGNVVSIDELVEKVGKDVTRFFFLMYSADTHMNFDLGLAEERSQKNPVFYVQYAHARIASVLRKASEKDLSPKSEHLELLVAESEQALLREIEKFPELIALIAAEYSVHRLPQYAIRLAEKFHSFYNECTVAPDVR
jgi:arginyl-tRNA synthetase